LNTLTPGINGPTSLAAIRNADDDLARIRSTLDELGLLDTTDIIVTSDHGFSTISKESRTSSTIKNKFADTLPGHLPYGFVALDLARALNLPLIDPDDGYRTIAAEGEHTKNGNGLIGGDRNKPKVVVAANGGSDLVYIPDGDKAMAKRIIDALLAQDYVSGIFVDSKLGKFSGALSLDDIALEGSAITPHPAIAISFCSFDTVCGEPVCVARSRLPTRSCSKVRACTVRSAAPTPGITWRCRGRTLNRNLSIQLPRATPISAAPSRS